MQSIILSRDQKTVPVRDIIRDTEKTVILITEHLIRISAQDISLITPHGSSGKALKSSVECR